MMTANGSSWDPVWEEVFRAQEWGKYPPEYVIRFVARSFYGAPDRKAVRLLDLGCGPGACTWYMAREGFSAAGIDGSETAICRCAERLRNERLAADLKVGDYTRLPWTADYFDGVIDNVSLYSNRFDQCRRAVAEVIRVLKPGGLFLSCNFTNRTWGYGLGQEVEPGTFIDIREGPLAGKGLSLFMDKAKIDELYHVFAEKRVEQCSWTLGEMAHLVELWIVTCRKQT